MVTGLEAPAVEAAVEELGSAVEAPERVLSLSLSESASDEVVVEEVPVAVASDADDVPVAATPAAEETPVDAAAVASVEDGAPVAMASSASDAPVDPASSVAEVPVAEAFAPDAALVAVASALETVTELAPDEPEAESDVSSLVVLFVASEVTSSDAPVAAGAAALKAEDAAAGADKTWFVSTCKYFPAI